MLILKVAFNFWWPGHPFAASTAGKLAVVCHASHNYAIIIRRTLSVMQRLTFDDKQTVKIN